MRDVLDQLLDRAGTGQATFASLVVLASALAPMVGAAAVWSWRNPDRRTQGAVALAVTWNAAWLLVLNVAAIRLNWWTFNDAGPSIAGMPVVLWLGWILLWGVIAPLFPARPVVVIAALAVIDLIYMPLMHPVLELQSNWLIGELIGLALVAWPTLLLVQWTSRGTRLRERVLLQVAMFAAILLWVIPVLAVSIVGQHLTLAFPAWAYGVVLIGVGAAGLPAVISVHDFFLNGGTPWPWERTDRPVRSGPYRYVRSPMQTSGLLVLAVVAVLYRQPIVLAAMGSAILYARLFSRMEETDLAQHFGADWSDLALLQRRWIPTWRPSPAGETAIVWINFDRGSCAALRTFLTQRSPTNLVIRDAKEHCEGLTRLRYERADGAQFSGVAAAGACLEHLHFGWAMIGWALRVPVLRRVWQSAMAATSCARFRRPTLRSRLGFDRRASA